MPYLQVAPLTAVLSVFLGIPLLVVVAVSFFDYDDFTVRPAFILRNYLELFGSSLTYTLYLKTLTYAAIVWALTLAIGFTVAYFLAFHVRTLLWQMALFLLCTVPFWTSNVIRMISWIPFLGLNGIFNQTLMALGLVDKPLEFLLFSDVAVVIAYVHLFTLFMIVPIFNSMARIDRALIEAAVDAGAGAMAGAPGGGHTFIEVRHGARLYLRCHTGDGGFFCGENHERRPERFCGARHVQRDCAPAVSPGGRERSGAHADGDAHGRGHPAPGGRPQRAFWLVQPATS